MTKKFQYLHPFFVALAPAIFLWSNNFAGIFLREVFPALAVITALAGLTLGFFWLFYRNLHKAAIVASTFLLFVFSYQYIFFNNVFFSQHIRYQYTFLISLIVIAGIGYLMKKTKRDLSTATKVITIISGAFILISLLQLGWNFYVDHKQTTQTEIKLTTTDRIDQPRDIYYIILDGYSAPHVLKEVMGFKEIDQTVNFLKERDFFVAALSQSNYPVTDLSLPSSLNLRYLSESENPKIWYKITEDHFLKDFFESYGYRYFHFGAGTTVTYFNRYADKNINMGLFSPYQMAVWETTAFVPIEQFLGAKGIIGGKLAFLNGRFMEWKRAQFQLEQLAKVSENEEGPIFTFAHFSLPKGGSVFDAEGNFLTEEEIAKKSEVEIYLGQAAYINKQMEILIDTILKDYKKDSRLEPIIIIQGDHGYGFRDQPELLENPSLEPRQIQGLNVPGNYGYSFPILNAYYFPGGGKKLLYDSITPVNSFRILLNYYFNQKFELLEDKSYTMNQDGFPSLSPYNK